MKNRILIYALIAFFAIGCSSDPCEDLANVECETGDADGDGVLNSTDPDPTDPCSPDPNSPNCATGDFDLDGILNGEDSSPEDPCLPQDNLACLTGDIDNDGIINSEDSNPEDPCLPQDNISCPTGDVDGDGIENSLDSDPEDRCLPVIPPLELYIIGKWSWGINGEIEFLADGTYLDINNQLLSFTNGEEIVERNWSIQNDNTVTFTISNADGSSASGNYDAKSIECNMFTISITIFDIDFTRI